MELFERKKVPVFNTSPENGESCASNSCDNDGELHKPLRNTCQTKGKPLDFHFGGKIMSVFTFLQWLFNSLVLGPVQHLGRIFYQNFRRYGSKNGRKTSLVFVINSVPSCDRLIRLYRSKYPHKLNFLGVDCEWVSAKDQRNFPVALLQIATPLSVCFLIRLCKMDGRLPQSVREVLEDRNILKFGVGIQDDSKKLRASYGVNVLGCVDLRHVVHRCRVQNNTQPRNQKMSLDALAWRILGVTMDKSWRIRCSNWEAEHLAQRQIEYAMNDALVASHMFLRLVQLKGGERKKPSLENERTGENTHGCVENLTLKDQDVDVGNDKKSVQLNNTMHFHDSETNREELEHFVKEDSADSNILKSVSEFESVPSGDCKRLAQTSSYSVSLDKQIENTGSSMSDDSASALDILQSCSESEESESVGFESKCLQNLGNFGASYIGNSEEGIDELAADLSKWESVDNTSKGYLDCAEATNILTDSAFCQRAVSLCQGIVDLSFKQAKVKDTTGQNHSSKETHAGLKLSGKAYKTGTIRKSPLYMNCMLAAPDGSMLCTLDRKKADWYVEKGIGELTNLDPYTIQLKFEPSGRPGSEDSYYLNFKDNICVVCGSDKSYMRKNIVPHDYRKHFPSVMKDHHSHDILLMCPECHCFSNSYDDQLRKELAAKYNAPIGNAKVARLVEDQELRKVKCAAKALLYAGSKIPEKRRQELAQIIQEYYKVSDLMPELISKAATMVTLKDNVNFQSHGQEVVKRVRLEGKLLEFEKMWRQHFLDTTQPEHLPPLWSVDHRHERLRQNLGQPDNS